MAEGSDSTKADCGSNQAIQNNHHKWKYSKFEVLYPFLLYLLLQQKSECLNSHPILLVTLFLVSNFCSVDRFLYEIWHQNACYKGNSVIIYIQMIPSLIIIVGMVITNTVS